MSMKITWRELTDVKSKKTWLLLGGIIVILGLIVYAVVAVKVWQDFQQANASQYALAQTKMKSILALPSANEQDRGKKLAALEAISTTVSREKNRCNFSVLFSWLHLLPANKEAMERCNYQSEKLSHLTAALDDVIKYLKSEQEMAAVIVSAGKEKPAIGDNDWPRVAKQWSDAALKTQEMTVSKPFIKVRDLATSKLQAISAAWQSLITASHAKDRAKYEQAIAALAKAYEATNEIGQLADTSLIPLAVELERSHKALD